jgi:ligand-binding sensor domain-containing protein/signal transduction histidine kinase
MCAIRTLLLAAFLQMSLSGIAQKQHIRFEHFGSNDGLSQSNVTCILQDSRGFMWFGTRDGLNKYDGYRFTVYKNDPQDKSSLSNNTIEALAEDGSGNIWVATWGGGLNKFDWNKGKFTHYIHEENNPNSISSDFIRASSMIKDSEGNLWIGTHAGLNMFDQKTNRFIRYIQDKNNSKSIGGNDVTTILEDSRHNLWVGSENGGLNLFNKKDKTFTRFQHDPKDKLSLGNNNVKAIYEDSRQRFWVGTHGGGLELFDRATGKFNHFINDTRDQNSLSHNAIMAINEGPEGHIWIGTENGGLNIFNPETGIFGHYTQDDIDKTSLNNNSIYSLYKDTHKNMWIGTFSGGINLVSKDANKFTSYQRNASDYSLNNNSIFSIYEDAENNLWIGTDGGGVNLFDRKTGKFSYFKHDKNNKNSICGNYVLKVTGDDKNNLWIGTWGDGLTVFNRKNNAYKNFNHNPDDPSSISSNNCWTILQDSKGNIWIGTKGGGLNLYNAAQDNFIRYVYDPNNPSGINRNGVNSIYEDSKGGFWIGTDGGGLNLLDRTTGKFTHFLHDEKKNSLSHDIVNCIFEDSHANLWIGTDVGLNCLDRKTNKFTTYLTSDGLPNNTIQGILEDAAGNLWISTNKGLSKFMPGTKKFKNFTTGDGLQSDEFKKGSCKSRLGYMYFGGINGFNEFIPDSIKDNPFTPPLIVTGFQIFNKEVPISDGDSLASPLKKNITETKDITLSYDNSVITFEFASLNYTIPEKKHYAYMLEGFDTKWNNIGTRRTATYTNLDPGEYIFKVKGLNNDGSWSEVITSFNLTITPPFWQTWWFRLLVVLVVAGSAIGFHRLKMKAVNKQKKKLEEQVAALLDKAVAQGKYEIASDVMHDIGNAVVGFGSYLTRIKRVLGQSKPENMQKLVEFFTTQKTAMISVIGEAKADAVIKMLCGIALNDRSNQEEINNSITEQLHIITHIQEILNIQRQYITGHESKERQPVNMRNIINDSMSMVFASIDKMSIAVSLEVPKDLPIIKGDRTKLMQVLMNVLKNSIESIDKNASEKTITLSAYTQANELKIQVKDSGNGFDKSTGENLFKKGFTTKSSGSGIGLYNCKTIVESHEGTIDITSEGPGKGALTIIGFKLSA